MGLFDKIFSAKSATNTTDSKFRMRIEDVFLIRTIGVALTGIVADGSIRKG